MLQQSQFFADRLQHEAGDEVSAQVNLAFQLAFARDVTDPERAAAMNLIHDHGLPAFCRALFNASEFLYVQ
jgi:hypothetical protein